MTRVCVYRDCAELNAPDATRCHVCGRPLVEGAGRPRCEFCGRKISYGAKRCRLHRQLPDPYQVPA